MITISKELDKRKAILDMVDEAGENMRDYLDYPEDMKDNLQLCQCRLLAALVISVAELTDAISAAD